MSYFVLGQEEFKAACEKSEGMGKCVSLLKKTAVEMEAAKAAVLLVPSNYQENYNLKLAEIITLRDKAIDKNKTIYFDKETPLDKVPKPDCQNFVKMEAVLDNIATSKLAIEEKLRHIVPPQVRVMQMELKGRLQEIINNQYESEQKGELELQKFLKGYGLPQALHAATSTTEIPPALWEKIEDFQKKGGHSNLLGMIQGLGGVRENNFQMIQQMHKLLEEEEAVDNQMRSQYQQKWSRMPSASLTANFKAMLVDYSNKATVALETDKKVEEKFNVHGDSLKLLNKTKNELNGLIPQSQGQKEISQNPTIVA